MRNKKYKEYGMNQWLIFMGWKDIFGTWNKKEIAIDVASITTVVVFCYFIFSRIMEVI